MAIDVRQIEAYIRQAAQRRGIDPDVAVRVARSEGLGPGIWQSNVRDHRGREPSYGPFQLLVGGTGGWPTGLGNRFKDQTGLDPSDPSTVYAQIDFALDQAATGGWSPWYGAQKVGVGSRTGLENAVPTRFLGGVPVKDTADAGPQPQPAGGNLYGEGPEIEALLNGQPAVSTPFSGPPASLSPVPEGLVKRDEKKNKTPAEIIGEAFDKLGQSVDRMRVPAMAAHPGGPSPGQANALLAYLNAPSASEMIMKKRLGGLA